MHNKTIITAGVTFAVLASVMPPPARAQLTYQERLRAEEIAKIEAKAYAQERAKADEANRKEEKARRDALRDAQIECGVVGRRWNTSTQMCK